MSSASLSRLSAQLPSLQQIEQEEARRSLLKFIQFTKQPSGYFADPFHVKLCGIIERFYYDVVEKKGREY